MDKSFEKLNISIIQLTSKYKDYINNKNQLTINQTKQLNQAFNNLFTAISYNINQFIKSISPILDNIEYHEQTKLTNHELSEPKNTN
jgi:hypothetical protein